MVHFCTGEPDYYLHLMEGLRGKGPVIAADPAQETYRLWDSARLEKLVSMSDRLFCNSFEAKVIAERLGLEDVTDLEKELVVRTDGSEGSAARIGGRIVRIPVVKGGEPVDAQGAGIRIAQASMQDSTTVTRWRSPSSWRHRWRHSP